MEEKISQGIKVEEDRFIAIAAGGKKENGEVKRMAEIPPLQYDYKVIQESDCDVDSRVFDEDKAYAEFLYEKEQFSALNELEGSQSWKVELPDGATCTFGGTCSVKLDGAGIAAEPSGPWSGKRPRQASS